MQYPPSPYEIFMYTLWSNCPPHTFCVATYYAWLFWGSWGGLIKSITVKQYNLDRNHLVIFFLMVQFLAHAHNTNASCIDRFQLFFLFIFQRALPPSNDLHARALAIFHCFSGLIFSGMVFLHAIREWSAAALELFCEYIPQVSTQVRSLRERLVAKCGQSAPSQSAVGGESSLHGKCQKVFRGNFFLFLLGIEGRQVW